MTNKALMDKLKEIAKTHKVITESSFSYFPELEEIRPLFNQVFEVLEKYREKNDLAWEDEIELFVDYEGFRFAIGEICGPYDQVYLTLHEAEGETYQAFEEVFLK